MQEQRRDTVIFDMGNVLMDFRSEDHRKMLGLTEEEYDRMSRILFPAQPWDDLDAGIVPEEECFRNIGSLLPSEREKAEEYARTFIDPMRPFPYALPWLKRLKARGYRLFILSNWPAGGYESVRDKGIREIESVVDGAVWSFQAKCTKPSREIFRHLEDRYGVLPGRSVFIDDSKENIKAARDFGYGTVLFTEYEEAREELGHFGILDPDAG